MGVTSRFPAPLARLIERLPQWPHGIPAALALNLARYLRLLPEDLSALEGRTFVIHVRDVGARFRFRYEGGRFRPLFGPGEPDLMFSADTAEYLKLLRREEDPDTLFFNRRLDIEGDTELGLIVKNMLDSLEPLSWTAIDRALRERIRPSPPPSA
ncbi:MAG: SCP2 sterol-binding domain-containing protein [Pseudomonadales bacterium]|jgi:predicted lipid carrier protein YhbT|nr:SCP2 sterol-binding domain-containing protein [Pseudomonadales bacterium]MCP5321614.1 SCP2 sterol-binding domain-containing protein [Pseudomonadales bacterium]MCP5336527.1 SCP2 sterol-binding domain-containing protein [Pseudomonadales bacterium]